MFLAPSAIRTHEIYRVTGNWIETGVTWSNQPTTAATATDTTEIGTTAGVWVLFDVTKDVEAFVAGSQTNKGWMIRDQTEGTTPAYTAWWRAKEYATASVRPLLTIRWIS